MEFHTPIVAGDRVVLTEGHQHPYLFLNGQEVNKIRALAQDESTYQHKHLLWLKEQAEWWLGLESPAWAARPETGLWVRDLGLLHALTLEQRYAEGTARALLRYADEYRTYPIGTLCRVGVSTLDESRWLVTLSGGYDLIYNSGVLNDEEKRYIEEHLLRASAQFLTIGPGDEEVHRVGGGICNYRVVENAAIIAVGFLLRDDELVNFALNSPRGFYRQLGEGVLDDGGWWEDSPAYHVAMIHAFTSVAEAAWHSGIDLYHHPKYLSMFQWPNHLLLPDGTLPATNDAGYSVPTQQLALGRLAALCYARTADRSLEALLARAPLGPILGPASRSGVWLDAYTLWIVPTWPEVKPPRKSMVLPATGKAILRTDPPAEDIDLVLDYGPHAGYHGHYDKCNIILYANGRIQAPDPGIGSYGHPAAHGWYRTTLAHNAVVVRQRNQPPSTGYLHLFATSPRFKIADTSPGCEKDENWGEQQQRRIVALVDETFLIDIYRYGWISFWAESGTKDWVYHNFGAFHTDERLVAHDGPLGEAHGYQYVTHVRRGLPAGTTWSCTFSQEGQGVKLTMLSFPGLEIIAGDGLGVGDKTHDQPGIMPLVIARANADGPVTWATVIEPFRSVPSVESFRRLPVNRLGGDVVREEGLCLEVVRKGAVHTFMLGYNWGVKSFGDILLDGQIAYLQYDEQADAARDMPRYAFLALGSHLERGNFCLRADRLATLYMQRTNKDKFLIENLDQASTCITLSGAVWPTFQVSQVDTQGSLIGQTATTIKAAILSFTLAPRSRYELTR